MNKKRWYILAISLVIIYFFGDYISNYLLSAANSIDKVSKSIEGKNATKDAPVIKYVTPVAPTTPEASPNPTEKLIRVTAKQLEQDYDDNQFTADEEYKGKLIEVTGAIITIDRDFDDKPYINLAANGNSFTTVWCSFDESDVSSLAKANKNYEITIQGICDGLKSNVNLKKCKVISISSEPIQINKSESLLHKYYGNQE